MHTPWMTLLKSFKGVKVCVCPEGDHTAQKPSRMVTHLLNKCKEKEKYIRMHRAAEEGKEHYRKGEVGYKKRERNDEVSLERFSWPSLLTAF